MGRRSRSVGRTRGSSRSRSLWLIIALVAVAGTAASVFVPTLVRAQALSAAGSRAENFISDAMAVTLRRTDAAHPVSGARYAELDRTLHQNLPAGAPVVQLTVWRTDGTILFSTEAGLVGKSFPDQASGLSMVVRRGPKTESHPAPPTDNGPRPYPGPTLVTRDALKVGGTNPVTVVAEVVQDYGTIVSPAEGLSLPVTGAFIVATLLAVGVLLAMALSRYEGSARTPAVTASPSTPTWYRGRTRRGAPGGPAPTALSPATGVNTLLQRLQARIQESAAQRIAAEDKARVAEDKARVAEERVNVIEGQAREKEEQLSATQSEVERLQVLLREAHEGGAGQAPDAPTAQELAEELNAARERATAAEEELAEAKRHVASARDEDTLIRTRAAQVEERLAATASRIEHLEARLAQSAEEVRAAHARAEQAEGWARQLQTDLQDAARRAENAEGRLRHVEETAEPTAQRAEAVEEWSRHLEEELEESRRRSRDSEERLRRTEEELAAAAARATEAEERAAYAQSSLELTAARVAELEAGVSHMQAGMSATSGREAELAGRIHQVEAALQDAYARSAQAESRALEAEDALRAATSRAEQAETQFRQIREEVQVASIRAHDAETRGENAATRSQQAEAELQSVVVRALRAEERIGQLEAELQSAQMRAQVAEESLREMEAQGATPARPDAPARGKEDVRVALRRAQEAEVRAAHAEQELQLTKEQLSELLEEEWEVKRELQQELRGLSGLLPDSS